MQPCIVRIIKQATLRTFWQMHPETREPLRAWYDMVSCTTWRSMQDVLAVFPRAVPLNAERVRFPIHGGDYRLIVAIHFPSKIVWIKFMGTHADYDRIDALTIDAHSREQEEVGMTDIRPIRTEADYEAALATIATLWGAADGSPESEKLEILGTLVGRYEDQHAPIEPPDPVEALKFHIDQGRLTQSDLARILGSRARASEILARRRRLTLEMVWRINAATGIPLSSLVRPYALAQEPTTGQKAARKPRQAVGV